MICQGLVSMCKFNNSSEETWGETLSVLFIHKASAGQTKNPFTNIYTVPLGSAVICHPIYSVHWPADSKRLDLNEKQWQPKNYFFNFWVIYYAMIMYYYIKQIYFLIFSCVLLFSINVWNLILIRRKQHWILNEFNRCVDLFTFTTVMIKEFMN